MKIPSKITPSRKVRVTEDTTPIAKSTPTYRTKRTKVHNVVSEQTPPIADGNSNQKMKKAKDSKVEPE